MIDFIYVSTPLPNSITPKTIESCSPRFWLIVVFLTSFCSHLRPRRIFIFNFFVAQSVAVARLLQCLLHGWNQLLVGCCVPPIKSSQICPWPHPPHVFAKQQPPLRTQAAPPSAIFRSLSFRPSKRATQRQRTQAQRLAACAWCWGATAP